MHGGHEATWEDSAPRRGNKDKVTLVEAGSILENDVPSERDFPDTTENRATAEISEEDSLRANLYGLLARLLTTPPSDETLDILRGLKDSDAETEIGQALANLGQLAVRTPRGQAEDEFTRLFYGVGAGGELTPTASFYLTGFVYEKPLAELRADLTELGVTVSGLNQEPEDHIAFLCETMHGLITGAFGAGGDLAQQRSFFQKHLAPWAARFFEDLEGAENATLYMPLGTAGKHFMAVEAEAFEMAA